MTDVPRKPVRRAQVLVAAVLLLCGHAGCRHDAADDSQVPAVAVPVRTAVVERRLIAERLDALGTCEALLDRAAVLAPAIEGRVLKIVAAHGAQVQAGQAIVQLDPQLAEANYQAKVAARDGLKAALELLKARPRPEEETAYRLAIDDAAVTLEKAESIVARLRPLRERNEISAQQMFEAELAAKQALLSKQKAETQLNIALLGPRAEAVDEANAHLAAAEADVLLARAQRDLHAIQSPIAGVVNRLTCKLGQSLAVGAPIGEVVDVRQVYALVWLPAFEARRVRVDQPAEVRADDRPHDAHQSTPAAAIAGKVTFVGQIVDAQTGNLPIRVLIDNPEGRFALGQTVAVAITVRQQADALAVPIAAIEDLGEGPQLSVVREGKSVVVKPQLGIRDEQWVQVDGTDLHRGESVIVEGGYNLPDGTPVVPEKAAASPHDAEAEPRAGETR